MSKIAIAIGNRDRPTELALLLQSLRTQTYKDFDIFILNDQSGTPLQNYHFFNMIVARLIQEGHKVNIRNTEFNYGVSRARQELVDIILKNKDYKYICRVDDDVILEPDFLERMLKVIEKGYDIASGVTPNLIINHKRPVKFLDIADEVVLDNEGNFIYDGDDCGLQYIGEKIVPCHHFRSSALMKREVHEQVKYWPTKLSKHGFREETLFSFKAQMLGYKIGVDLQAIAWHLNTPSGGERFPESGQMAQHNQQVLDKFVKENKKELTKLFPYKEVGLKKLKDTNMRK